MKLTIKQAKVSLKERLDKLSSPETMTEISKVMGNEALRIALQNAGENVNAQGRAWTPTKTGSRLEWLSGSIRIIFENLTFRITSSNPYAYFQIMGASKRGSKWHIPARSFAPKSGTISKRFRSVLDVAHNYLNSLITGKK